MRRLQRARGSARGRGASTYGCPRAEPGPDLPVTLTPTPGDRDHEGPRPWKVLSASSARIASTSAGPRGGRPPVGIPAKRASRGGQSIDLRLEQLVVHGQRTDLALEPLDLDVAVVPRPCSEGGLAASEKGTTPSARPSCCHAELARRQFDRLTLRQPQHCTLPALRRHPPPRNRPVSASVMSALRRASTVHHLVRHPHPLAPLQQAEFGVAENCRPGGRPR